MTANDQPPIGTAEPRRTTALGEPQKRHNVGTAVFLGVVVVAAIVAIIVVMAS